MYRVEFAPGTRYDCQDGQTYSKAREALEKILIQSLPAPPERLDIDRKYAYRIRLHAVVNVANLDAAAIEQTIARFQTLEEKSWVAD